MGSVYRIAHDTRYGYSAPTPTSRHTTCLRPRDLPRQRVLYHALEIEPAPAERSAHKDWFGNTVEHFTLLGPHTELVVRARSVVEVFGNLEQAIEQQIEPGAAWDDVAASFVYSKGRPGRVEAEYLFASPYVEIEPDSLEYARPSFAPGRPLLEAAVDLMHRMHADFVFDAVATTVTTPVSRVLAERRGVCQDLAHVMISCLRSMGLPARYVSGYLVTDPPPGQPRLVGADASHAWVSVLCGEAGWIDLDPTNDMVTAGRHVVIGWGRDYGDVSPLRGVFVGGGEHVLKIGVDVHPVEGESLADAIRVVEPPLVFAGGS